MEKNKKIWSVVLHGITQNIEEILNKEKSSTMLSNSELIIMLNQSSTDRERLSEFFKISETLVIVFMNSSFGK